MASKQSDWSNCTHCEKFFLSVRISDCPPPGVKSCLVLNDLGFVTLGLRLSGCKFTLSALPSYSGGKANLHPDSRKPRVTNPKSIHEWTKEQHQISASCWFEDFKSALRSWPLLCLSQMHRWDDWLRLKERTWWADRRTANDSAANSTPTSAF